MDAKTHKDLFKSDAENTWCPGCGDFAILDTLKDALVEMNLMPHEVVIGSGIGQAGKLPHYINANAFNGLHGRAIPPMLGIRVANKDLKIFVCTGEGDSYGEGGNHMIHNMRRNIDIVHIVHDNQVYGLTKGQGSPTTQKGQKTSMQFDGVYTEALNPIAFAIASGASFVARSFSGNPEHLKKMIIAASKHKGYALIDVFQPCVSFNKVNTFKWYKDHTYILGDDYDPSDKAEAFKLATNSNDQIPLGIIYHNPRPTLVDSIKVLSEEPPLVKKFLKASNAQKFLNDFR
jgi:2-oxoglutarate ferredoxin oxidoreductase subunit beta